MQQHIQTIVKHFFQQESLRDVSEQTIEQFTADYPYAAVGQLLLAAKKQESTQETFDPQAVKTSLYFNNPTWLQWQLQILEGSKEFVKPGPSAAILAATVIKEEPVTPEATASAPIVTITGPEYTSIHSEATDVESPGVRIPVPEENDQPAAITIAASNETREETQGLSAETLARVDLSAEAFAKAEAQPISQAQATTDAEKAGEDAVPFEAYHTIDYFASQGIKLRLEDLPKDKLGQQLKSFTEWLRSMKRITPTAESQGINDTEQQSIQLIAEHSVSGKDVVTEAMAEVWVKQGNYRKAIAIYEKLSLQNPVKSPYFADRIQQLKAF